MRYLGYLIGPLGCAVGMVVCMAMMARANRRRGTGPGPAQAEEATALRPATSELRGDRSASDA